jgi:hypothetical protein
MSCLYIYMYMWFEVVQTIRCLRVVHALSGKNTCSLLFFMAHSPYATPPARLLPSATAQLSTPSNYPPRCRPLWPYQSRLPDPSGLRVQFPHSLSIPPWILVLPPLPHSHTEDARTPAGMNLKLIIACLSKFFY